METVTNRNVRQLKQKHKPGGRSRWFYLMLLAAWLGGAAWAYLRHPYLQTLDTTPRLLFSLPGPLLWLTWPAAAPLWHKVVAGALPINARRFGMLYIAASAALPALPWLAYQWWLSLPAAPRKIHAYRAEKHRQQQRQLTASEARHLLKMEDHGLPLASLNADQNKRDKDLIGLEMSELEGHVLVVSPTGGGKGMHLTETLLRYPRAAVVIDPKGEQYQRTAGARQQLGPVYNIPQHTLDLAHYYDLGNRDDVAELHFHLMRPWADRQPVFADKCKSLFTAAHAFAARHGLNPIRVLLDAADSDPARALAALATADRDSVMAFTNGRPPHNLDRMSSSAWGTFATRMYGYQAHVGTITTGANCKGHNHTTIPLDWVARNATIYVTYAFNELKGVGGVVSAIMAALMRHQLRTETLAPALVAVDELPAVGLRNVPDYLATVRGYGLTLLLYVQTYAQLVRDYSERDAETILSNCQHQVWYPPGNERTAARIEASYGTKLRPSLSLSRSLSKERFEIDAGKHRHGVSEGLQKAPALAASQITALDEDEVILRVKRKYAVRAYRLWPVPRLGTLPPLAYIVRRPPVLREKTNWRAYLPDGHGEDGQTAGGGKETMNLFAAEEPDDHRRRFSG